MGAKHKSWVVELEGRKPFPMGGDPMSQEEAEQVVRDIWPWAKFKVRPAR